MYYDFGNACRDAREAVKITQEKASELLGCSPRSVANYEGGKLLPPDATVARMIGIYNHPLLGYRYLSLESPTGKMLLPKVRLINPASGALQVHLNMDMASGMTRTLDSICCDNEISEDEVESLHTCQSVCSKLMSALMAVRLMKF